jgi:hypothetical protein
MANLRYEVSGEYHWVRAWNDDMPNENGEPFLLQDLNPTNNLPWTSKEEAQAWADNHKIEMEQHWDTVLKPSIVE